MKYTCHIFTNNEPNTKEQPMTNRKAFTYKRYKTVFTCLITKYILEHVNYVKHGIARNHKICNSTHIWQTNKIIWLELKTANLLHPICSELTCLVIICYRYMFENMFPFQSKIKWKKMKRNLTFVQARTLLNPTSHITGTSLISTPLTNTYVYVMMEPNKIWSFMTADESLMILWN